MTPRRPFRLDLAGLGTRPAQVWGGIRLVPLVRERPLPGLRLHAELYGEGYGVVSAGPRAAYVSYIPHGFVADWGADAGHTGPSAAYGTQLRRGAEPVDHMPLRLHRRMVRREAKHRLRFLPLHLALDGYLALRFGGPATAWEEWSRRAVRNGLPPRAEEAYSGASVRGLGDALRVFELHPGQCGVLVYAADTLAAAFAVPHPEDYRALHPTLLLDLYGELIYQYALLNAPVPDFVPHLPDVDTLTRFLPPFRPREENHIGEAITTPDGRIAYLKTFRLSETQIRRSHLLTRLAANDWHLGRTATELGLTDDQLALRIESAGFGLLLRQDMLDAYRKRAGGFRG